MRPGKKMACRARVADGFVNFGARLGLGADNQLAQGRYAPGAYLSKDRGQLEDMYRTSWLVGRMVNVVAEDMVRGGIDIRAQWKPGRTDALLQAYRKTGCPGRLSDAIKWGRLYGGAMAVLLIDGDDPAAPLELACVPRGAFRGLYVLDRWHVTPSQQKIMELGPMLGYPEYYRVNAQDGVPGMEVHHSRVLRFVGTELPLEERMRENFWGASVIEQAMTA